MAKKKALFIILLPLFLILTALSARVGKAAYADDINLRNVDRVVIDLSAVGEDGEAMELTPTEGVYVIPYGATIFAKARLDDADMENAPSLYDDVYMYYQWFYSADGSEFAPQSERIVGETNVGLTLTEHAQSGVYYIQLTNVQYGGEKIGFTDRSDSFAVSIVRRTLTVEYTKTETVYNGETQNVEYTVSGELAGHPAHCYVDYDVAPSDAGTYSARVRLNENFSAYPDNDNYHLESDTVDFVISKAPLTVKAEDVVVLAGYSYEVKITYEGFCGRDDENSLEYQPTIVGSDLSHRSPGFYEVVPNGPRTDKNYEITYLPGTIQINRSTLEADSIVGFTGKATGSFSSDAALSITESGADAVAGAFMFWQSPTAVYNLKFTGSSNKETYTVVMENVELSGWVKNICFVNEEGKTEKVSSFSYDKDKKTLTLVLTQTSGYVVVYHNYLWYIIPAAVVLILIISLLIFHHRDRNKHKLNRLIAGSAKVEADIYREKIGAHEEKERRKI